MKPDVIEQDEIQLLACLPGKRLQTIFAEGRASFNMSYLLELEGEQTLLLTPGHEYIYMYPDAAMDEPRPLIVDGIPAVITDIYLEYSAQSGPTHAFHLVLDTGWALKFWLEECVALERVDAKTAQSFTPISEVLEGPPLWSMPE